MVGVLTWAIRSGSGLKAREAAQRLSWDEVFIRLQPRGPLWERLASYEALAAGGTEATDDQVAALTQPLLEDSAERDQDERSGLKPGPAARRALATLLSALDPEHFAEALEHVRYETEHSPFPPRDTTQGLLLATDAGLCDASELIAEVFCFYDRAHLPGFSAALKVIERSELAKALVRERAIDGFVALLLAAHVSLPDDDDELRRRAAGVIRRALEGGLNPDEILRPNDRGLLARWAPSDDQAQVARWLVDELADPSDIDVHRYEAGEGLMALAPALAPATASSVLDRIRSRAGRITEPSAVTELQSDPNPHFARVKMRTPRASDHVRAVALTAECELAARSGRLGAVGPDVARALNDEEGVLRAAALRVAHQWPGASDVDFAAFMTDDAPEVRSVALSACAEHGGLDHEAETLAELCRPDHPLALRCAVLGIAREKVDMHRGHLEQLARDPHVYVRAAARHALGER